MIMKLFTFIFKVFLLIFAMVFKLTGELSKW